MDAGQHAYDRGPGLIRRFLGLLVTVAIVIGAVWFVRTYVTEPFVVPTGSMETTIMAGDRVFTDKVTYQFSDPQAGDIVVFPDPQVPSRILVKRVVATEGQTVDFSGGVLYIDGIAQTESYARGESRPLKTAGNVTLSYPYTIPQGEVWVMGDNRENSSDSRYFGPIDEDVIFGKALLVYWPLDRLGLLS